MNIELITPARGARVSLLTAAQQAFIDQAGQPESAGAQPIDFLNLNRSEGEDCSLGAGVALAWRGTSGRCRVALRCRAEAWTFNADDAQTLTVRNLRAGERYDWSVCSEGRTAAGWFETENSLPRFIHLDGDTNVRDLGGWPTDAGRRVRQGLIYRGSEFDRHMQLSPRGLDELLHRLRVRTDLDLREETQEPGLDAQVVRWVHQPISAYAALSQPEQLQAYGAVFRALLNEEAYPIYVHCWGGADRTGCLCYLLLALLGVQEEHLLLDYEVTSLSIWGKRSRSSEVFEQFMAVLNAFAPRSSSPQLRAERYWQAAGITPEEMNAFRRIMLEDA